MDERREGQAGKRIGLRRRRWLEREVGEWAEERIISPQQGGAILSRYAGEAALRQQWGMRAFLALCGVAAVMFAVGVILLVGRNWEELSREMRTGMIFGVMVVAFAASSVSYGMGRAVVGEVLALLGVLLLGAGIWLTAQVYHIEAHYPDGFLWWMVGAMAGAALLKSRLCAMAAIVLMAIWTSSETFDFERANYLFLAFWAVGLVLAYWQKSVVVLVLELLALAWWLMIVAGEAWGVHERNLFLLTMLGAVCFAVGLAQRSERGMARAWQVLGVLAVLVGLVGPSFEDFHRYRGYWWREGQIREAGIAGGVLLVVMAAGYARAGAKALKLDWPMGLAAVVSAAGLAWWMVNVVKGTGHGGWQYGDYAVDWWLSIAFSAVMLVVAVWLIVRGVRKDRGLSFFTGVLYLLLLVLLRWVDLIGDMVSSAILFFAAGAVLLITAYFWRKRERIWGSREVIDG